MTAKKYRTAMGKTVDIGAIMLQNESIRAVGNMSVNARGDTVDSNNRVIDRKAQQIQRQNRKTNVVGTPMTTSHASNDKVAQEDTQLVDPLDTFTDLPEEDIEVSTPQGGLAAAIAKAKTVQQTKITPSKQAAKAAPGVRKI